MSVMVKRTVKTEIQEVEIAVSTEYFCDRCGAALRQDPTVVFSAKTVFKSGWTSGPDGGEYTKSSAYFCPECAAVVRNTLIACGVKFSDEIREW